jgi:hypothetical protein
MRAATCPLARPLGARVSQSQPNNYATQDRLSASTFARTRCAR